MKKRAFSMLELVFVLVIIGILASIAVPKFAPALERAKIYKLTTKVLEINSAIAKINQKIASSNIVNNQAKLAAIGASANGHISGLCASWAAGQTGKMAEKFMPCDPSDAFSGVGIKSHLGFTSLGQNRYEYDLGGMKIRFIYSADEGQLICDSPTPASKEANACEQIFGQ